MTLKALYIRKPHILKQKTEGHTCLLSQPRTFFKVHLKNHSISIFNSMKTINVLPMHFAWSNIENYLMFPNIIVLVTCSVFKCELAFQLMFLRWTHFFSGRNIFYSTIVDSSIHWCFTLLACKNLLRISEKTEKCEFSRRVTLLIWQEFKL